MSAREPDDATISGDEIRSPTPRDHWVLNFLFLTTMVKNMLLPIENCAWRGSVGKVFRSKNRHRPTRTHARHPHRTPHFFSPATSRLGACHVRTCTATQTPWTQCTRHTCKNGEQRLKCMDREESHMHRHHHALFGRTRSVTEHKRVVHSSTGWGGGTHAWLQNFALSSRCKAWQSTALRVKVLRWFLSVHGLMVCWIAVHHRCDPTGGSRRSL